MQGIFDSLRWWRDDPETIQVVGWNPQRRLWLCAMAAHSLCVCEELEIKPGSPDLPEPPAKVLPVKSIPTGLLHVHVVRGRADEYSRRDANRRG